MHDHRYEGDDSTSRVVKKKKCDRRETPSTSGLSTTFVQSSTGNELLDVIRTCIIILIILI